jgi:cytochrome c oxidase cbb3-type subunit 2
MTADVARRGSPMAVGLAITATYVSFLLHAQFGFLALVEQRLGAGGVPAVMTAMGLAGLVASLGTGVLLRFVASRRVILVGLMGCAFVALASLACRTLAGFAVTAALVGVFTAGLTVALASSLRFLLPGPRRGLHVGLATGAAYFVANLPPIFHGAPVVQALVAAGGCLIACAVLQVSRNDIAAPPEVADDARGGSEAGGLGFATLVAGFLALVWLDSAAFRIVQETADLQGRTWGPGARTLSQGVVHLVAAIVAGHLVDRGRFRSLLVATFAMFAVAFAGLSRAGSLAVLGGPLYAAGISTYSTALVLAPSLGAEGIGLPRRWRAAILYAVAGWLGSALGIGMAQDLHRIPAAFTVGAGAVLLLGALLAHGATGGRALRGLSTTMALAAVASLVALRPIAAAPPPDAIARGRATYIAEGCIQCHSQYVRPGADELTWGPMRQDQLDERPPLIGTRRVGPDLLEVGNRRSSTWERLHLIDPRSVAPASRMPSYAHLFASGDSRGDDLVAYLDSLGASTAMQRDRMTREAPMPAAGTADAALGRAIFSAQCAPCHGKEGHGDGPLAASIASPYLDLRMAGLPRVQRVTGDARRDLERTIRFGIPGGAMAGHELLSDLELASVAARVAELRGETP